MEESRSERAPVSTTGQHQDVEDRWLPSRDIGLKRRIQIVLNACNDRCILGAGTRGMGTLGTLFLGSVAYRVVHLVHVPVTLVR